MANFMQQIKEIIASIGDLLQVFWQWQYSLWVVIAVAAAVVIIVIAVTVTRRKRRQERSVAAPQMQPAVPRSAFQAVQPSLPLGDDDKLGYTIHPIDDSPRRQRFASLSKKLQAQHGVLTDSLEAECVAAGADFLPELLAIYELLDPRLARDLQEVVKEQQWLPLYAGELGQEGRSKEFLLQAWRVFPDVALLPQLVELLANKDEHVRLDGVWLLIKIHDKRSLPYLVSALLQPKRYLTARVGEVFLAFDDEAADLLAALLPQVPEEHRLVILELLGHFAGGYPLVPVLDCLRDVHPQLRVAAATALGESDYFEAQEAVLEATYDQEAPVRAAAVKALGRMRCQAAEERLRQLLADDDFLVRANAKEALDRLELD